MLWRPGVRCWDKENTIGLPGLSAPLADGCGVRPRAKRALLPHGGEDSCDAFQSCTVVLIERIELFGIDVEDATDL